MSDISSNILDSLVVSWIQQINASRMLFDLIEGESSVVATRGWGEQAGRREGWTTAGC
jgi:hypothetical protein